MAAVESAWLLPLAREFKGKAFGDMPLKREVFPPKVSQERLNSEMKGPTEVILAGQYPSQHP